MAADLGGWAFKLVRILTTLTYYRPHFSGLTVYTERLARALTARGHQVTVLTSRYDRDLQKLEVLDGLKVRRVGVAFRVSKGVIMPTMPLRALRLVLRHDVVHVHVPQLDAAYIALLARVLGRPVVMTYHCDLRLPRSPIHWLANQASKAADLLSAAAANAVVTNTRDYAENSPFLNRYLDKLVVIPPPVSLPETDPATALALGRRLAVRPDQRIIGMVARLATEKGAEFLALALPEVLERFPTARVLYVGQYRDVLGEEPYAARLQPSFDELGEHWSFLGVLPPEELGAFFRLCDVTVLPSLNQTESFGMVQIESMIQGTPVVASDIPGVRCPVRETRMGLTVPPCASSDLAQAIIRVLESPEAFRGDPSQVAGTYSPAVVAARYEKLFLDLVSGSQPAVVL